MRNLSVLLIPALAACIIPAEPAAAGYFMTGNELLASCTTPSSSASYYQEQAKCMGYIIGAFDAFNTTGRIQGAPALICSPEGIVTSQIRDIVVAYLRSNPESRHYAAGDIVMLSLTKAFPCAQK